MLQVQMVQVEDALLSSIQETRNNTLTQVTHMVQLEARDGEAEVSCGYATSPTDTELDLVSNEPYI